MVVLAAFFDKKHLNETYRLRGKYLEHFTRAFPDFRLAFNHLALGIAYLAGKDNADKAAYSLKIKKYQLKSDELSFEFQIIKETKMNSGQIGDAVLKLSKQCGWLNQNGWPPLVCLAQRSEFKDLYENVKLLGMMNSLMQNGDYKGVVNLFAPLKEVSHKPLFWNDADILYRLGVTCSKLAVTLLIKASETKKLRIARQYREYCVTFLKRGAAIEQGSARCATALAYRYYSNVHELTRQGERKDQSLEEQISKANEWLSRAIEVYPLSVRNNYRKGKLIVEKQAPYLLYGKRSFGTQEARLLREIREVGEEHLASAVAIYELQTEREKQTNRREYAKALFVLGGYYLDSAYLPVHEYFSRVIAGAPHLSIPVIAKLDIESAIESLEKCFYAETDIPLGGRLDAAAIAPEEKNWTRSPVEKLYRLGCAYSAMTFIDLVQQDKSLNDHAQTAVKFLECAKKLCSLNKDRKRNTWHISEKIAWTYIYLGQYARAARLLSRASAGYIANTYAIALLLTQTKENAQTAKDTLETALHDKNNLAMGLTRVLYGYTAAQDGQKFDVNSRDLSAKNSALAKILGLTTIQ
ncbi:MAG: hypothetical protein ACOX8Q_06490 [Christensenellales bacterium]|jgi:hypothetical protein